LEFTSELQTTVLWEWMEILFRNVHERFFSGFFYLIWLVFDFFFLRFYIRCTYLDVFNTKKIVLSFYVDELRRICTGTFFDSWNYYLFLCKRVFCSVCSVYSFGVQARIWWIISSHIGLLQFAVLKRLWFLLWLNGVDRLQGKNYNV